MSRAWYEIDVRVLDEGALRAFAMTLNDSLDGDSAVEELLEEVSSNARVAPLDAGYEIMSHKVVATGPGTFRARVEAEVLDGAALASASLDSYAKAWGDAGKEDWEPADLGEALYEQSFASDASPAGYEIGIEVVDSRHEGGPIPSPAPGPGA